MNINIKQLRTLINIIENNALDIELEVLEIDLRCRIEYSYNYTISFILDKEGRKYNFQII